MSKNFPNSKTTFPDFPTGVDRWGDNEYEIPTQKEYLDKIIDLQVQRFINDCQERTEYDVKSQRRRATGLSSGGQ